MNFLLADLKQIQERLLELEKLIAQRGRDNPDAQLLKTMPGIGAFTAISLAAGIGDVQRFPRAGSLANYWGLTPGCRNSGENNQRLGRITKAGNNTARWLLAQVTYQVLRKDGRLREWYKKIKRRRGSGVVARVAVMRKLTTVIWHILSKQQSCFECRAIAAA
ncbi:transposase [Planctomicrobium sp. SH527]|uniref:transposase n=1 Tax=Planctomicrobium sp. SH527 TaxID=3448123 RepID=UPI003F5BFB66